MYLALYRKYRPQTFDDVISQEHITTTLKNQLINHQTSHAYLFTGSRGTGKTTCAKILAKAINCLDTKDGNPCLKCSACLSVAEETPDIVEIDAASNTGVDSVRALKEEAVYTPLSCKYKVYIIDEVHMLSTAAFNALLKLIEEPPAHVVFIFATTETHKIPATILSRCQRFDFRRIDIEDSKKRLIEIAEKEGNTLDEEAAFLISRISDGGMRDALSLLDQCFAASSHVTEAVVRSCSGISGTDHLFAVAKAVIEKDCTSAINVLDELVQKSKSPVRFMEELIAHYRILMLLKAGAERSVLRISADEENKYRKQNEKYSMESILRAISILTEAITGKNRMKNEQLCCEMCLIRLCTPTLDIDEKALSGRIDALERTVKDLVMDSLQNSIASEIFKLSPNPMPPAAGEEEEKISLAEALAAVSPEEPEENDIPVAFPIGFAEAERTLSAPEIKEESEPFIPEIKEKAEPPLSFNEEEIPLPTENAPPAYEYGLDDIPPPPEYMDYSGEESFPAEPKAEMEIPLPFDMDTKAPEPKEEDSAPKSLSEALGLPPSRKLDDTDERLDREVWIKGGETLENVSEEGYEPLREWAEIIETLPFSIKMLVGETTARIKENTVMVFGPELQKAYAVSEFSAEIREAVSKALGRNIGIVAAKSDASNPSSTNYVKDFLDYAMSQGVIIKEQK